jgi:adenylate cyclase
LYFNSQDVKDALVINLSLRPSILTLFVLLTVPAFLAMVVVTYISNEKIARSNADQLVERFRTDAIQNIQHDFDPIKSLVRSAAVVGAAQPDFYSDNRSLRYLFSIIQHSEKIVSMYVGLADGSFRQARQIEPNVEVQSKLPPPEARYAFRWIDAPTPGTAPTDHYLFLDAQQKEIGKSEQVTAYDPRARMWYRMTQQAGGPFITDPDVFAALGLIGFTVGAPIFQEGKLLGIAAADITLDGLSDYLAERKISPGTLSYILDHQGRVIANSERTKTYTNYNGRVELQHITSLGNDVPAIAFSARPRDSEKLFSFSHDGRDYVASMTTLPSDFGKRWQLFVVTPLGDFTSAFDEQNKRLALFGAIAILLQICIIYFLSSVVSAPLERLALKVTKIQNFEGYDLPSLQSPIREVEVLARAIDTLDSAVKSFAAFVPVGLVRQLLDSDQKLVLGGHSRFLTIFFSDLEAFSTMSEEVPSQELLSRVSAYLGVVTHAVNMEHGTIDKFIGDGVMAFWGAPALLEDHAQRSCFAALRIREGMKELNAGWEAAGAKPLNVRMGIHSDAVLVGNIGSKERMSYTVMGDGVNIAARLEGINKEYGTRICISHTVFKEAGERLCVRPVDDVTVKGRRSKVPIYELVGAYGIGREFEPDEVTVRLCDLTRKAYTALVAEDYVLALSRYQEIAAEYPDDPVARTMAKRLAAIDPSRLVSLQMSR